MIAGEDGLDDLRLIINNTPTHINEKGWLLVEHGYDKGEQVQKLFAENNFESIKTIKDLSGNDRVSLGQYV